MTALFLLGALFVLLLLRVPIAMALGLASILTVLLFADESLVALAQRFFSALQVYQLLSIPFFVLAGAFMTTGGVAKRMIAFANALVGHFRGGLAMAALLVVCPVRRRVGLVAGDGRCRRHDHDRRHGALGLHARVRGRADLQRGHDRHPDPALDRHGRVRRRDGNVDRQPVRRRHPARACF